MARTTATKLVLVALVAALLLVASDAAISGGQVTSALGPCLSYARGNGASPSAACCSGVRRLAGQVQTAADKKAACLCIKSAAGGVKEGKAAEIPSKCRVSVPYKISSTVNCNKI
ncbi:Non-specific lipid-transfer protein 4.1 [Triticum urartu]|uniref:Non-specific lipid-transfer protein n=1 Tax=Triticum urartu TaxID=4572 RepID=M8AGC6_TRIUA|nr:non-specific lipid-transfer protein 4.1-like [Triticum urartu]EMS59739.1 Non-specific lipid-transfer protein 4.1 [Triticum urartu]